MKTLSTGDGPAERAVRSESDELVPGDRVASYRVVRLIGRGGMGEVYEAVDTKLGRSVALKRIASHRREDGAARARFWREARGLATVKHEGLVAIYEIGEDPRSGLFIAMELVDGAPLSALVIEGEKRLGPATAVALVMQAADALGAAHAAGLVHRDIKPGNLLVERRGRVRVVDFGLARKVDDIEQLTRDGAVLGTPAYMAPEQVDGRDIGPPADVFALGLVLYRVLSGVHPFARDSSQATALAIAGSLRRSLDEVCPGLPPELVALVDRALAVAPTDRFADGAAFAAALRAIEPILGHEGALGEVLAQTPWPVPSSLTSSAYATAARKRGWPWLVAGGLVAVVAVFFLWKREPGAVQGVAVAPADSGAVAVTGVGAIDSEGAPLEGVIAALPPRPVVFVLGFAADDADVSDAAVTAEVMRVRLAEHEGRLDSVPLEVAHEMVGDLSPGLSPKVFARPNRRLGHVDLIVRGRWTRVSDKVSAQVELVETTTGRVVARWSDEVPDSVDTVDAPIALADRLSATLKARLGLEGGARVVLSRVPAAWTALMAARRAARGADLGGARKHLEWALRADPEFSLAKVEELAVLRMEQRLPDLLRLGHEVVAKPERLTPQSLGFAEAHVVWAEGRSDEALRLLDRLLERFPYEVDPAIPMMALRAKDSQVRDPAEVERIAKRVLSLAPRQETSASRYVRALGIQGRVAEAERFLTELGLERSDKELAQIWAEVDLFAGRFEQAAQGFAVVLAAEPGNVYYEHMAITAALLAGRCTEAAGTALDRITRLEAVQRESMLDWTYSLAVQATICAEAFEGLPGLLEAWRAHSASGRTQSDELADRVAVARAKLARDQVALASYEATWREALATVEPANELASVGIYLRIGLDPKTLDFIEQLAKRRALDRSVAVPDRWAWRTIELGVAAKRAWVEGLAAAEVIARHDAAIPEMTRIAGEDESRWYVESLVWKAEALESLGDPGAKAAWAELRDLGFHRLWFTELWVLAKHRAGR